MLQIQQGNEQVLKKGVEVTAGTLNMIEMAFRAYDPCFSCATHSLPGEMPMILEIRDSGGELMQRMVRN